MKQSMTCEVCRLSGKDMGMERAIRAAAFWAKAFGNWAQNNLSSHPAGVDSKFFHGLCALQPSDGSSNDHFRFAFLH